MIKASLKTAYFVDNKVFDITDKNINRDNFRLQRTILFAASPLSFTAKKFFIAVQSLGRVRKFLPGARHGGKILQFSVS